MTSERTRVRLVRQLTQMGISNPEVLNQIKTVPRHLFIDEGLASRAYENTALPIGHGQTISQPYIVARMTELLLQGPLEKVLEIGAGCGYQSAVLSEFADKVFAVERIASLAIKLRERIQQLRYPNILVKHGDGMEGWAENSPYDAILVAAAPVVVPPQLLQQLKVGGRLIIPVGNESSQTLLLITREDETNYSEEKLDAVSFVPMRSGVSK
ncbi:MAG: protein-L-isoaspartate(D-aspartate) O-methyltransferase [Gammaproteobacteria bacterium]